MEVKYQHVAFSPDMKTIVLASSRHVIEVRDLATGEKKRSFGPAGGAEGVTAMVLSPDGKKLASAGAGQRVLRLWNFELGKEEHCHRFAPITRSSWNRAADSPIVGGAM